MPFKLLPRLLQIGVFIALASVARSELELPSLFSDHMVLQRDQSCPVWGWDDPGTRVTVQFAAQRHEAVAGSDRRWSVSLRPMPASGEPRSLLITGTTRREITDVLVGEVWLCSGQSNMERRLPADFNGDLAILAAANPGLRFIRVPNNGTQEPQRDFRGEWSISSPQTASQASAVGYYFGDYLQRILRVPIGLIDNSWGGSNAEAWIARDDLEAEPRFQELIRETVAEETYLTTPAAAEAHEALLARWQVNYDRAKAVWRPSGVPLPPRPQDPEHWLRGNRRAGNLYAGVLHPLIGYGIKGVIWYQGEGNSGRASQYAELFPFLIRNWRDAWGQGDFPFYWVQLPDFRAESTVPGESTWAELREAQTSALSLPNTGQAVTIGLGEGRDIHPRQKFEVASRLARIALARDYGQDLPFLSPRYREHHIDGGKIAVTLDCFDDVLRTFDTQDVKGFTICGPDQVWHLAHARLVSDDTVEVWSAEVTHPIAVRYAWADNPICNLFASTGLPVTPFRTDKFKLSTVGLEKPQPAFPHP